METIIHHPIFFTATIRGWKKLLMPEKYKYILLNLLKQLVTEDKIILYSYCLMDNPIHLIWRIKGDYNPTEVQKPFLESISKEIKKDLLVNHVEILKVFTSTQTDRSYHFWKRRPLSIEVYSPKIFNQKPDYIHNNPVNAEICELPEDYIYSVLDFILTVGIVGICSLI